ncbi:PadR family transcriptional regulator [Pseudothermotoga sp. U03pept]|uniref:PadR family transcriptional regulator n=1 Tax=Pseudothermotoga sp. U03pept TaxID=3447012 RepID=UPI003F00356E
MKGFQHGRFRGAGANFWITTFVLCILSKKETHGYELFEMLAEHFPNLCPCRGPSWMGAGYRILRELELQGLITSRWETGEGPAKRTYSLTPKGKVLKEQLLDQMKDLRNQINRFLQLVEGEEV